MIAIDDAQQIILDHVALLAAEELPLLQCLGRVSARDAVAAWDVPLTDNSTMDGYAFCHAALQGDTLAVAGVITAGERWTEPLAIGKAVKIMTGAPLPPGCDTVIPVENVTLADGRLTCSCAIAAGANIRRRGDDLFCGDTVISAGTELGAAAMGVLASIGVSRVAVISRPQVAVIATGDELVAIGERPLPGTLVNSNSATISAQIAALGGLPLDCGIVKDDHDMLCAKFETALDADAIVITGGVSMGDKDYVKPVIEALGGEIKFWQVNLKPGKPFAFALLRGKPVFAIPGNPVSAMITFELFVRPALLKMQGHRRLFRPSVKAVSSEPLVNSGDRTQLQLVTAELHDGCYLVTPVAKQRSSRLTTMLAVSGYVKVAAGESYPAGTEVALTLI